MLLRSGHCHIWARKSFSALQYLWWLLCVVDEVGAAEWRHVVPRGTMLFVRKKRGSINYLERSHHSKDTSVVGWLACLPLHREMMFSRWCEFCFAVSFSWLDLQ